MRSLLALFVFLIASLCAAYGQVTPTSKGEYNWPVATSTGVVGNQYLVLDANQSAGISAYYTIQVYITGTAPSVCTFEVQSSPDTVAWDSGVNSISGDQSCLGSTSNLLTYSFYSKPARNIRINVGTLTGGDGTTSIKFFYTAKSDDK